MNKLIVEKILSIIYRLSVFVILADILLCLVFEVLPLGFVSTHVQTNAEAVCFYSFMIAILCTLTGTLKKEDGAGMVIIKILLTLFVFFFGFILAISIALGSMFGSSYEKTLFTRKNNSQVTIIGRASGGGATDNGEPLMNTYKQRILLGVFTWTTKIDTATIDYRKWERVPGGPDYHNPVFPKAGPQ